MTGDGNQQRSGLRGDPVVPRTAGDDTRDPDLKSFLGGEGRALIEQLKGYARHKESCPLHTSYRWAYVHHFENHDGDDDWPVPTCGNTDCIAWAAVGEHGEPDCACGLETLLDALLTVSGAAHQEANEHVRFERMRLLAADYVRAEKAEADVLRLTAYRDRHIALGLDLGEILGPDYDGTDLRDVARELVTAKADVLRLGAEIQQLEQSNQKWMIDFGMKCKTLAAAESEADRLGAEIARGEKATRLKVLTAVHEYWEFESISEDDFDAWMHRQIKAARPPGAPATDP